MTILSDRVDISDQLPEAPQRKKKSRGSIVVSWLTSTDHKVIGYMYLMLSTFWFFAAGAMALAIRAELAIPGLQFISLEQYNQLFTMHGTIMLFLFATPLFVGYANVIMPLQIGSPDVAFPRLNMLGLWLFVFGGLLGNFVLVPAAIGHRSPQHQPPSHDPDAPGGQPRTVPEI